MPRFAEIQRFKDEKRCDLEALCREESGLISYLQAFMRDGYQGLDSLFKDQDKAPTITRQEFSRHYELSIGANAYTVLYNARNLWLGRKGFHPGIPQEFFSFVRRQGGKGSAKQWRLEVFYRERDLDQIKEKGTYGVYERGLGVIVAELPEQIPARNVSTLGSDSRTQLHLKHQTGRGNTRGNKNYKPTFERDPFNFPTLAYRKEQSEVRIEVQHVLGHEHFGIKSFSRVGGDEIDAYYYCDPEGHFNVIGRDLGVALEPFDIASDGQHFNVLIAMLESYLTQIDDNEIHCDIKPANMTINEAGVVSFIDLGLLVKVGYEIEIGGTAGFVHPEATFFSRNESGKLGRRGEFIATKSLDHYALSCVAKLIFGAEYTATHLQLLSSINGFYTINDTIYYEQEVIWHELGGPRFGDDVFENLFDMTDEEKKQVMTTIDRLSNVRMEEPADIPAIIEALKAQRDIWQKRKESASQQHAALIRENILSRLQNYSQRIGDAWNFIHCLIDSGSVKETDWNRLLVTLDKASKQLLEILANSRKYDNHQLIKEITICRDVFYRFQRQQLLFLYRKVHKYESKNVEANTQATMFDKAIAKAKKTVYQNGYLTVAEYKVLESVVEPRDISKIKRTYQQFPKVYSGQPDIQAFAHTLIQASHEARKEGLDISPETARGIDCYLRYVDDLLLLNQLKRKLPVDSGLKKFCSELYQNVVAYLVVRSFDVDGYPLEAVLAIIRKKLSLLDSMVKPIAPSLLGLDSQGQQLQNSKQGLDDMALDKLNQPEILRQRIISCHQSCVTNLQSIERGFSNLSAIKFCIEVDYNALMARFTPDNLQNDLDQFIKEIEGSLISRYTERCRNETSITSEGRIIIYLDEWLTVELEELAALNERIPCVAKTQFDEIIGDINKIVALLRSKNSVASSIQDPDNRKQRYDTLAGEYRNNIAFITDTRELFKASLSTELDQSEPSHAGGSSSSVNSYIQQLTSYTDEHQDHRYLRKKVAYCAFNIVLCTGVLGFSFTVGLAVLMTGPLGWAFTGVLATALGIGVLGGASTGIASTVATCKFWQKPLETRIIDEARTIHQVLRQSGVGVS